MECRLLEQLARVDVHLSPGFRVCILLASLTLGLTGPRWDLSTCL